MVPSTFPATTSSPYAVIIGAGPAGLATAGFLAEAGWHCEIFEALSREMGTRTSTKYLERAYGLSCQQRTLNVLRKLHAVDDVLAEGGYWREATFRHDPNKGAIRVFGADPSVQTLSVLRTELVGGILKAVERQWGDRIALRWNCRVLGLNIQRDFASQQKCHLQMNIQEEGSNKTVILSRSPDLIVCADGSGGAVGRNYLAETEPGFTVDLSPSGIKARTLLLRHDKEWIPSKNSLHFVPPASGEMSSSILLAGRHTGPRPSEAIGADVIQTMMMYPDQHELDQSNLEAPVLKRVLTESFTSAQLPLEGIVSGAELERCASSNGATLPGTVTCSRYHSQNLVIIGDSAHQAPANAAQGVNCALEDAMILSELLLKYGNVTAALEQFTLQRKPDVDALQRMMNHPFFAGVRPTWRSHVVSNLYQTTRWPALRPLPHQVGGSLLTYRQCERNMMLQYHLPVVLAAVGAILVGWLALLAFEQLHALLLWWKGQSAPLDS